MVSGGQRSFGGVTPPCFARECWTRETAGFKDSDECSTRSAPILNDQAGVPGGPAARAAVTTAEDEDAAATDGPAARRPARQPLTFWSAASGWSRGTSSRRSFHRRVGGWADNLKDTPLPPEYFGCNPQNLTACTKKFQDRQQGSFCFARAMGMHWQRVHFLACTRHGVGKEAGGPCGARARDSLLGKPHRLRGFLHLEMTTGPTSWDAQTAFDDIAAAHDAGKIYASVNARSRAMLEQLAVLAGAAEFLPWARYNPSFKPQLSELGLLLTAQGVHSVAILLDAAGTTQCFICARLAAAVGLPPSSQVCPRSVTTAAAGGQHGAGVASPDAPQP